VEHDPIWRKLAFVYLGLFGAAVAVAGLLAPLPLPAAGGTCGPGQGSETAAEALLDPVSIGAQAEPPASETADRAQWVAFVHDCQTAADHRGLVTVPLFVVSVGVAVVGTVVVERRSRRRAARRDRWTGGTGPGTPSVLTPPVLAGFGAPGLAGAPTPGHARSADPPPHPGSPTGPGASPGDPAAGPYGRWAPPPAPDAPTREPPPSVQ
jgi:hypothetical protein